MRYQGGFGRLLQSRLRPHCRTFPSALSPSARIEPEIAASHARALGPWGAAVLPFEQPVRILTHLQRLFAIEVGWQAGGDLTSEAMQPRKAT
jgi:hypothetical protein